MATKDMALIIGGALIPKPSTFLRNHDPNETDRITLGGTLYTDFINTRRSWKVGWKLMTEEDYETIRTLYFLQYTNETYHFMQFDAYGIYTPVKIEMSEENIRHNGGFVENFNIIIKEQYAIS